MSLERGRIQKILDTKNTWLLNIIFQVLWETSMGCKVKELESSLTAYTHNRFGRVGFDIWGISLVLVKRVPSWCKGFVVLSRFSLCSINWKGFCGKALVQREIQIRKQHFKWGFLEQRPTTLCDIKAGIWRGLWEGWHCQNLYFINLRSEIKTLILEDTPWQCVSAKQKTSKASLKICCPFLPLTGADSGSLSVGKDSELDFHWKSLLS